MSDAILCTVYNFPEVLCSEILSHSNEVVLSMGEVLSADNSSNSSFYILISGCLRQIVLLPEPPNSQFSLSTYQPPFLAGYASLTSGISSGTFTAAEDSILLKLSFSAFSYLSGKYSQFAESFGSLLTAADIWPLILLKKLPHTPSESKELKSWVSSICERSTAFYISPGSSNDSNFANNCTYFVADNSYQPFGTCLSFEDVSSVHNLLSSPLRVISLPSDLFYDSFSLSTTNDLFFSRLF